MAQRRMFSKSITNSSQFLMMPQSSQNLYFHLGMNADDDGFCEHFSIMRMTDSKPDDLKVLQAKGFVSVFDDKVLVITDWKENNYIQKDRYSPSKYLEIYKAELKALSSGIQNVYKTDTQVRLGKVRKGNTISESDDSHKLIVEVIDLFKEINPSYSSWYKNKTQRASVKWLLDEFGMDDLKLKISHLKQINSLPYAPVTTTPYELKNNLPKLKAFGDKMRNKNQDKDTKKSNVAFK